MIIADTVRALGDAFKLASEGRHCFRCASSKRPATPHGFLDASADPVVLRELWTKYAGPLVGVRTGSSSGIDVLDLDRKHRQSMVWWAFHRDRLPLTRVHRTRCGVSISHFDMRPTSDAPPVGSHRGSMSVVTAAISSGGRPPACRS